MKNIIEEIRLALLRFGSPTARDKKKLQMLVDELGANSLLAGLQDLVKLKLFWVPDDVHEDDWFVVANTEDEAETFYKKYCFGYDEEEFLDEFGDEDFEDYCEEDPCGGTDPTEVMDLPGVAILLMVQNNLDNAGIKYPSDDPLPEFLRHKLTCVGWPSDEVIEACGGSFLKARPGESDDPQYLSRVAYLRTQIPDCPGRVAILNGKLYIEGDLVRNFVESQMGARPDL